MSYLQIVCPRLQFSLTPHCIVFCNKQKDVSINLLLVVFDSYIIIHQ